jgi:hypothetical protein
MSEIRKEKLNINFPTKSIGYLFILLVEKKLVGSLIKLKL